MITLDPQTERRIRQELSRGNYTEPADLINHALDLLNTDEHLTADDRARFDNFLALRMAEADKGKLYSAEQAKDILAERRAARLT